MGCGQGTDSLARGMVTSLALKWCLLGVAAVFAGCIVPQDYEQRSEALSRPGVDLIVRGGPILTGDAHRPEVEAMAVRGSRIQALGTSEKISRLAGRNTTFIELDGQAVVPGFVDAHTHVGWAAWPSHYISEPGIEREALLALLAAEVDVEPELPLMVAGWMPVAFSGTRQELDAISTERPILVMAMDWNGWWLSSAAIEWLGIEEPVVEPPIRGAPIDENGMYTGLFLDIRWTKVIFEKAVDLTPDEVVREMILSHLGSHSATGVTSIGNMTLYTKKAMRIMVDLAREGLLSVRVREFYDGTDAAARDYALSVTDIDSDFWRVAGVKYLLDGSPFTGTVAYSGDYLFTGPLHWTDQEVIDHLVTAANDGEIIAFHQGAQLAARQVLDAMDIASQQVALGRIRFEHSDVVFPEDIARMGSYGVTAVLQPAHWPTFSPPVGSGILVPSEEISQLSYLNGGVGVAIGSDDTVPPLVAFAMSMIGPTEAEAFSFDQVLTAATATAAYAIGVEEEVGTLTVGRMADFVVLPTDPRELPPSAFFDLPVIRTVVGGQTTFLAE